MAKFWGKSEKKVIDTRQWNIIGPTTVGRVTTGSVPIGLGSNWLRPGQRTQIERVQPMDGRNLRIFELELWDDENRRFYLRFGDLVTMGKRNGRTIDGTRLYVYEVPNRDDWVAMRLNAPMLIDDKYEDVVTPSHLTPNQVIVYTKDVFDWGLYLGKYPHAWINKKTNRYDY